MTDAIRIVVADDHPLFLDGVVNSIIADGDMVVVGQASDAVAAVELTCRHLPDIGLLDLDLPGGGLSAVQAIAERCPATKTVVLTVSEDEDDVTAAMRSGASGYILKGVSARELRDILRSVHAGEVYVTPSLAGRLVREMSKPREAGPLDELSARELEVLELVASGLSNQEIGRQLSLAEKTIKHYMTNILTKLQVRSRIEAALLAYKAGLVPDEAGGKGTSV